MPTPAASWLRPNIVCIICDDVSAADIGCYGNRGIRTPHLDRLAARGLRFTRAYVTAPSCSPSRCSLLTSRYPHNLETAAELHGALPAGVPFLPTLLREAGYFTMQAGKAHFGTLDGVQRVTGPAAAGFDFSGGGEPVPGKGGYGGEEQWLARLRSRPPDRPFFAWLASHDAHRIWDAAEFAGRHRPEDVSVPSSLCDTPETRRDLAHYYDEIGRLDHHVGEVVEELEQQGVLADTMIVFLADHGRPFPRAKTHLYEEGVATPLIICPPASWAIPPAVVDALVSTLDLAPTWLELAGGTRPTSFQGVSLTPLLRDPTATVRDVVFAEQNWHNFPAHVRLVREGDWAYLRNAWPDLRLPGAVDTFFTPSGEALRAAQAAGPLTPEQANAFWHPRPKEELYNLREDPTQACNLATVPEAQGRLSALRALLDQWTRETGDTVPTRPTRPDTDLVTGKKLGPARQGEPPGAAAGALRINAPGPIRSPAP